MMRYLKLLLLVSRISMSLFLIGVDESASGDTPVVKHDVLAHLSLETIPMTQVTEPPTPKAEPSVQWDEPVSGGEYDYIIKVEFDEIALVLYDRKGERIKSFPVSLPRVTPKKLPIEGKIERVERRPFWYPTKETLEYFKTKRNIVLPDVVSPGDPQNAMGAAKIVITFKTSGVNPLVRIHGTNEPDSIGKRASSGCIRMHNNDLLTLADMIKGKHTYVVFE